ncbi:MAG: nitrate- and nitrite sensing domain-containing protein, partial [Campylobacteraceae bacterium]|nr:nitrate- and nitrite sensing domain-containing protein [Campylobacteraceae bacterium]
MNKKIKILLPIIILISIFSLLSLNLLNSKVNRYKSISSLEIQIHLATNLSKLIDEIQLERGLSIGFVMSKGQEFEKRLKLERINTNKKINEIILFLKNNNLNTEYKIIQNFININDINKIRALVNSFDLNENQTLEYYTSINTNLLNVIINISKLSDEKDISQNIIAYIN